MKKIIIIVLALALIALQGTAAGYTHIEEFTINGDDWTNLSTCIDVDYITYASVNYSAGGGGLAGAATAYYIDPDLTNLYIIDSIAASGNNIYYAEKRTGYSPNGKAVFPVMFDDFDTVDTNIWNVNVDSADSYSVSDSILHIELADTGATRQIAALDTKNTISTPCIIETRAKVGFLGDNVAATTTRSAIALHPTMNAFWDTESSNIVSFNSYRGTSPNHWSNGFYLDGTSYYSDNDNVNNVWINNKYIINSGAFQLYRDGNLKSTVSQTNALDDAYLGLHYTMIPSYATGTQNIYYDWVRVRKYAANEPTVIVTDKGAYYEISVSSVDELTNYQIAIPCSELGITSDTESWKISQKVEQVDITPKAESGIVGTTTTLNETNPHGISTINLNGIQTLHDIEHILTQNAELTATIEIEYSPSHAVLKTPANDTKYYQNQDTTIEWYSNPTGTTITYEVALDSNFYSIVEQGSTTSTSVLLSNLDFNTYYWKISTGGVDTETRVFTKINQEPPGLFNFSAYNEESFSQINSYSVKLYNSTWYKEKSTTDGEVSYNSSEVNAGEYTALVSASGYSPRWYVVNSPSDVSVYLPSDSSTVRLCDFNLMDYTNQFNYPDTRLIVTKTTNDQGTIIVSDRYFDASGSNPVYLLDYNNYILTLQNTEGYQKSIGSYLPIANAEVSLVVGEIATIPDTSTHGGFNYNITKDNGSIILKWNAPSGSLNSAFDYNITVNNNTVYEIESLAPYGTATYYMTSNDTHMIWMYADTTGGIIDHQEYYRPQNQLVDLNISDFWYNVFGLFVLIVMGLLFSFRSAKTGAILVAFCAVALSAIGMLHISTTVLSLAVVVAIAGKLSEDKQT